MTSDDKQEQDKDESASTEGEKLKKAKEKQDSTNTSSSGLTQQFGKPIVDRKAESLTNKAEDIEAEYKKLKNLKKMAVSGVTHAFGDLLGKSSEKKTDSDEDSTSTEKPEPKKEDSANTSPAGLTRELGKPGVDPYAGSLASKAEDIEAEYARLRELKRSAVSGGVTGAFGDLLGKSTEKKAESEPEKSSDAVQEKDDKASD